MRNIEVSKTGYEDGHEAGEGVRGAWERARTARVECWLAAAEEFEALGQKFGSPNAAQSLKKWRQEDALDYAAWLHEEKMRSLPDLTVFPELRGMDKYLDDQARGFAAGAGIDIREVYLDRYWGILMWHACGAPPGRGKPPMHCTEVVLVDTSGRTVVGKGWDDMLVWYTPKSFSPGEPPSEVTVVRQPPVGPVVGYRSGGGVNEKGLAIESGGGAEYEYEAPRDDTLFPAPVWEIVMASCANVEEAVELLTRYREYWGPCNSVVVDATGDWVLIEKSRHELHVSRGRPSTALRAVSLSNGGGLAVTTYGGCDSEPMRRLTDTNTGLYRFYQRRLAKMREIGAAAESAGRSRPPAKGRSRDPDSPPARSGLGMETLWEMVLHHDREAPGCVHYATRPPGVVLVCCGCFGLEYRVEDDGTVRGERYRKTLLWDGQEITWACAMQPVKIGEFIIPADEKRQI